MVTRLGIPFEGLKKAGFTGSERGMRFFIKATDENVLTVWIYPEPYSFDNTDDALKISKEFEYTQEGVDQIVNWLNEAREQNLLNLPK